MRLATLLLLLSLAPAAAQSWAPQASGTGADLHGVHFVDAQTGVAVGAGGVVARTTDGGQSWALQTLPADDLEGVAFNPSGTVGLAASDDGPVFRTTDGGATWSAVFTGAGDLRDVSWADDDVAWVAGRDGDAAVSADGGLTWAYRNTGSVQRTESVAAVSAAEAFVGNRGGEMRRTTDGGLTWMPVGSGTGEDLTDIQMLGATGFVAGSGDTVLKTTNGGTSWVGVSNGEAGNGGLFFLDPDTGWTVGEGGEIWFTSDGGASWVLQPSGTGAHLAGVHFPTPTAGWAVGAGGAIVHFSAVGTAAEPDAPSGVAVLSTAEPNPFSTTTQLVLTLERSQTVTVAVVDALGRRVATLHEGTVSAGAHRMTVRAADWPAGVYVVRASGEAFSAVRHLTLVR
ncbi:MAG: YCF48-related protein [Rubricoccaceae bacterium]|nr:YCF48-related protein [Rubricoccaceae bacterium]